MKLQDLVEVMNPTHTHRSSQTDWEELHVGEVGAILIQLSNVLKKIIHVQSSSAIIF